MSNFEINDENRPKRTLEIITPPPLIPVRGYQLFVNSKINIYDNPCHNLIIHFYRMFVHVFQVWSIYYDVPPPPLDTSEKMWKEFNQDAKFRVCVIYILD